MTYSLVLAVPAVGMLAAATASRSAAVGSMVPAVWPGVGAVVSQAWTNTSLRGRVLSRLAGGADPTEVLATLSTMDPGHARRQVGVVDVTGRVAAHTGEECSTWAGARAVGRPDAQVGMACGNLLAGEGVVTAIGDVVAAAAAVEHPAALADLLVRALQAGQRAGGDVRGQQSAALLVATGGAQGWQPPDLAVDLRVDDHEHPLDELERMLGLVTPRRA